MASCVSYLAYASTEMVADPVLFHILAAPAINLCEVFTLLCAANRCAARADLCLWKIQASQLETTACCGWYGRGLEPDHHA